MQFHKPGSQIFVPDGQQFDKALTRTTHLAIGAHADDIEIMAIAGILECYQRRDCWFSGVVVTDGAGSPREGEYLDYTDEQIRAVRSKEQIEAARMGEYASQFLLDYPSAEVKDGSNPFPVEDLREIIKATSPQVIYTHNPADKHPTHVAVVLRTILALRSLPDERHPEQLIGCEFWRDLDWMPDKDKVVLNCSGNEQLQVALLSLFESQIVGGKRYDLATMGRRHANATYYAPHEVDQATGVTFGIDLLPLIKDPNMEIGDYVGSFINRFREDVTSLIVRLI
jgi:LmbE family N-acetylglucosaminyl deacetylase